MLTGTSRLTVLSAGEYTGLDELPGEVHRGDAQIIDDCGVYHLSSVQLSKFMEA